MGDSIKIKPKSQEIGDVFAWMLEHPGEVATPEGEVSCKNE